MHDLQPPAPVVLAEALVLMSVAKPILFVALFVAYMRFVAKFEFDARRFTQPRSSAVRASRIKSGRAAVRTASSVSDVSASL